MLIPPNQQAISGQDYMAKQGRLTMYENQTRATINVVIMADDLPETEEQFLVNLTFVRWEVYRFLGVPLPHNGRDTKLNIAKMF